MTGFSSIALASDGETTADRIVTPGASLAAALRPLVEGHAEERLGVLDK